MAQISSAFSRDANGVPITTWGIVTSKTVEFTGAAGLGAQGTVNLYTVTGDVMVYLLAQCTEDLASTTGTIEAGIAGNTAGLIAQTTASAIDTGEVWTDATPTTVEALVTSPRLIKRSANIIATVATADVTDGTLVFYCIWTPLSSDGNVVAA